MLRKALPVVLLLAAACEMPPSRREQAVARGRNLVIGVPEIAELSAMTDDDAVHVLVTGSRHMSERDARDVVAYMRWSRGHERPPERSASPQQAHR